MVSIYVDRFYDNDYEVVERKSLNYFDPKANSNKFYIAEIHANSLTNEYRLYINYGRQGQNGQESSQPYDNINSVTKAFTTKVASKTKKGYVEVELATFNRGSGKGQTLVNTSAVGDVDIEKNIKKEKKSKLNSKIIKLIKHIYEEANQAISMSLSGKAKSDITAPLGNLGQGGIERGREILKKLSNAITSNDDNNIEEYSIEYYKFIPRDMGNNIRHKSLWLIDSQEKVQNELDTLDLYEDTLRMLPAMTSVDIDSRYDALNCEITTVEDKETLDYINHKVTTTIAHNHHYKLEVVNAYEISQKNAPKFDDSCGNVVRLFHGSRSANLVGILSSYLKLPKYVPASVSRAGSMFGPGIYLASDSSKSFNYSQSRFSNGSNKYNTAFLFICETALGEVYEVQSSQNFQKAPNGYHSVKGCKGKSLLNNEFIVYNENQVRIKYMVECRQI